MHSNQNRIHQAIVAREVIEIYKSVPNKSNTAEPLDVLCFAMARLTEKDPAIDWDELASIFDHISRSDDLSISRDLEEIYKKISSLIQSANSYSELDI